MCQNQGYLAYPGRCHVSGVKIGHRNRTRNGHSDFVKLLILNHFFVLVQFLLAGIYCTLFNGILKRYDSEK